MIITEIKDFLVDFVGSVGYPGVFVAMAIESCLVPLPSEITMPVAGALAAEGAMNVHIAAWVGAFGNVVGSMAAYGLGRLIPEESLNRFIDRWGKFILISTHEFQKAKDWVYRYGSFVSFFSRLLPGIRTVISVPAGMAKIPIVPFIVWTFLGSLIWSYVLVYAGYLLGDNWESIEPFFEKFQIVIIVLGISVVAFYVYHQLSARGDSKVKIDSKEKGSSKKASNSKEKGSSEKKDKSKSKK